MTAFCRMSISIFSQGITGKLRQLSSEISKRVRLAACFSAFVTFPVLSCAFFMAQSKFYGHSILDASFVKEYIIKKYVTLLARIKIKKLGVISLIRV